MFKTLEGFRSREIVKKIVRLIHQVVEEVSTEIRIMHVCGTHEQALRKHAIDTMLPAIIA